MPRHAEKNTTPSFSQSIVYVYRLVLKNIIVVIAYIYIRNLYIVYIKAVSFGMCILFTPTQPPFYTGFAASQHCRFAPYVCFVYGSENWKRWLWDRLSSLGCHNSWRVHLLVKFLPFVLYYTAIPGYTSGIYSLYRITTTKYLYYT